MNLDEYQSIETDWIAFYVNPEKETHFEHIQKKLENSSEIKIL